MSNTPAPAEESNPAPEPDPEAWDEEIKLEESPEDRKRAMHWLELLVVLCLAWIVPLAYGVLSPALWMPSDGAGEVIIDDLAAFVDLSFLAAASIQVLVPLLWIVWRGGIKWSDIGIVRIRWVRDIALGLLLAALILGIDVAIILALDVSFLYTMVLPQGAGMIAFMALVMILNSLYEEFVWRGYMLHRLKGLLGSMAPAVVVSTVLFASYHIYQGLGGAFMAGIAGLVWCISVILLRSIWPAVISHTAFNIYVHLHFAWFPGE
jgi:uncharacterized protein